MLKIDSLISYKLFEPHRNLLAFTTTKQTLPHAAPRFTGNNPVIYQENRNSLALILNVDEKVLIFPRQTHTNCVATISSFPKREFDNTDALITNKTGLCLCVQTADCVPILLFDPQKKVIAAVHAGWRGTVKKIVGITVNKMVESYNCLPLNIQASIGPSIGPEAYEIGDDVVLAIEKKSPNLKKALIKFTSGKIHFDLWEANRLILNEFGISNENIEISEECSFSTTKKYFSARRDGVETGRMVSGIMLLETK